MAVGEDQVQSPPAGEKTPTVEEVPVLTVRDTVIFLGALLPITIGRPSSIAPRAGPGENRTLAVIAQLELERQAEDDAALIMQENFRILEEPSECSYLPEETASLEVRCVVDMTPGEYAALLARGYRRFGWQLFRPACPNCAKCRSVRVLVREFSPNGSERRILRKNENIRAQLRPLFVSRQHIELYNLYHRFMSEHRGWPLRRATLDSYRSDFLSGAADSGRQWLYFEKDKLVGVALMDEVPGAISLVYCFYHPGWRARSPGTFSILNQLLYAKASNLEYAYLGYWIESSPSMSYKGRFHPREILKEYPPDGPAPVWE